MSHPHEHQTIHYSFSQFIDEVNLFIEEHEDMLNNLKIKDFASIASVFNSYNNYNFRENTISLLNKIDLEILSPESFFDENNKGEKRKHYETVEKLSSDIEELKDKLL